MKLSLLGISALTAVFASYSENNQGYASFDISMPIDATGYTLHGQDLTGGPIQFTDQGVFLSDLLSSETGDFELSNKFINTTIHYDAIKFINPMGIRNLFIKIGKATRTQKVSGLDPSILKDGTYTWDVPIFAFGSEKNDVEGQSENMQFMQIGTGHGDPSPGNGMYTQDFYLYTRGQGTHGIAESVQPSDTTLAKAYTMNFTGQVEGVWGAGGADPYRTITGQCKGESITFPAGPNLDYEYGTFTLPTVHTPWTGTPADHCIVKGEKRAGCVNAMVDSSFHFIAQKIRVPINATLFLYAEFGTAHRRITPKNLRYQCEDNVYLKNILPKADCLKKSYLPGSSEYPYFAVGYEFITAGETRYATRYIYLPEQENGNRLAWLDASATRVYAISSTNNTKPFREMLDEIRQMPSVYDVLGEAFFMEILKKNGL